MCCGYRLAIFFIYPSNDKTNANIVQSHGVLQKRIQCPALLSKKYHSKTRFLSCRTPQEISQAVSKNLPDDKHESNSVQKLKNLAGMWSPPLDDQTTLEVRTNLHGLFNVWCHFGFLSFFTRLKLPAGEACWLLYRCSWHETLP